MPVQKHVFHHRISPDADWPGLCTQPVLR